MAYPLNDMTGRTFGWLKVLRRADPPRNRSGFAMWECECRCSTVKAVAGHALRSGNTLSCGCLGRRLMRLTPGTRGDAVRRLLAEGPPGRR